MERLIEILKQIRKYSEWIDNDSIEELKLYLDEIRELSIDAIEIQKKEEKSGGWVIIKDENKIEKKSRDFKETSGIC